MYLSIKNAEEIKKISESKKEKRINSFIDNLGKNIESTAMMGYYVYSHDVTSFSTESLDKIKKQLELLGYRVVFDQGYRNTIIISW